jgi:hypothetical protein
VVVSVVAAFAVGAALVTATLNTTARRA